MIHASGRTPQQHRNSRGRSETTGQQKTGHVGDDSGTSAGDGRRPHRTGPDEGSSGCTPISDGSLHQQQNAHPQRRTRRQHRDVVRTPTTHRSEHVAQQNGRAPHTRETQIATVPPAPVLDAPGRRLHSSSMPCEDSTHTGQEQAASEFNRLSNGHGPGTAEHTEMAKGPQQQHGNR